MVVSCIALFCSLEMETFTRVVGRVYHIEANLYTTGSLVFSTSYGFYAVNVDRQPHTPQLMAGREGTYGYLEGKGKSIQSSPRT